MKIQTRDGLLETKVLKHVMINNRKVSIHRWINYYNEFDDDYFTASDYATGLQIPRCKSETIQGTILNAEYTLNQYQAVNYDYSKHEVINT